MARTRRLGQWREEVGGDRLYLGGFGDAVMMMGQGMAGFEVRGDAEDELVLFQRNQGRELRSPMRFDGDDAFVLEPTATSIYTTPVRMVREPIVPSLALPSLAFHALWTAVALAQPKLPRFMPFMLLESADEQVTAPVWAASTQECVGLAAATFRERRGALTRFAFVSDSTFAGPDGEQDAVSAHVWMPRSRPDAFGAIYALGTPSRILRHSRMRVGLSWLADERG